MRDDLLSRALSRTRDAAAVSRISRSEQSPGTAKSISDNVFPVFPGIPVTPGNDAEPSNFPNRAGGRVDAQAGARARVYELSGNPGNPGNLNTGSGLPSLSISRKEEETGKSGKRPGLFALACRQVPGRILDPVLIDEWFEERAAIREFDGGLTRVEAEAAAAEDTIEAARVGWIASRLDPSQPSRF